MKRITILLIIIFINALITLPVIYRNRHYKADYISLFGKDKYIIETVDNGDVKFYTLAKKNTDEKYDEFKIIEDYMNKLGFMYLPDRQMGCLYVFANSDGKEIECDATHFRNYTEWYIHFIGQEKS